MIKKFGGCRPLEYTSPQIHVESEVFDAIIFMLQISFGSIYFGLGLLADISKSDTFWAKFRYKIGCSKVGAPYEHVIHGEITNELLAAYMTFLLRCIRIMG